MEDIKGQKFGLLTVLNPTNRYRREQVWECRCECGNVTNVRISKLKNGATKSCGCFKKKNIKPKWGKDHIQWKGYEDISLSFYNRLKECARQRDRSFNISIEYLWDLFLKQEGRCAYTGRVLILPTNTKQLRGVNEYVASLDRVDNTKDYIEGNVQWIYKRVNYMKHTLEEKEFLKLIKEINEYRNL